MVDFNALFIISLVCSVTFTKGNLTASSHKPNSFAAYLTINPFATEALLVGVFNGAFYVDNTTGKPTFANSVQNYPQKYSKTPNSALLGSKI